MAFKITPPDTFKWPIKFDVLADGKYLTQSFDIEFVYKNTEEFENYIERLRAETDPLRGPDAVSEIVLGWTGITDGADSLQFSQENLAKLVNNFPGLGGVIVEIYVKAMVGLAKRKNSSTP